MSPSSGSADVQTRVRRAEELQIEACFRSFWYHFGPVKSGHEPPRVEDDPPVKLPRAPPPEAPPAQRRRKPHAPPRRRPRPGKRPVGRIGIPEWESPRIAEKPRGGQAQCSLSPDRAIEFDLV